VRIEGAKVLAVGMGQSGLAVAEFLSARGATVRATDSKPLADLKEVGATLARLGVEFVPQSPAAFEDADWIVVSPGVPFDIPELVAARSRGIAVIGEVELASSYLRGETIGVTGSNGKTTTTSLIGHILRESGIPVQVGGNIGKAVTAMVAASRPEQWNALELSSFQLETIDRFRARIGVCVNVTPDHLDRHRTFENYAGAKGRLFETQAPGDFAVLNADDAACLAYAPKTRASVVWFSTSRPLARGLYADNENLYYDGTPFLAIRGIPLRGRHNVENALAAAGAAHLAGAPLEKIAAAVRTFPGVEHRIEFVRKLDGIDFYNDSKATNVDAAAKALDAFDGPLWIVLGGKDKGSPYTALREQLAAKAKAALLIGAATPKIVRDLEGSVRLIDAGTLDRAVALAWREAAPGDTILLAPACASFDQFESYEHRGHAFKELVARLEPKT